MWVLIPVFYGVITGWLIGWTFLPWTDPTAIHCYSNGLCYH